MGVDIQTYRVRVGTSKMYNMKTVALKEQKKEAEEHCGCESYMEMNIEIVLAALCMFARTCCIKTKKCVKRSAKRKKFTNIQYLNSVKFLIEKQSIQEMKNILCTLLTIFIILILLIIGGVEINPGPYTDKELEMEGLHYYAWKNIDSYLTKYQRHIEKVHGNGFCILQTVCTCLKYDYCEDLTIDILIQKMSLTFYSCISYYSQWYAGTIQEMEYEYEQYIQNKQYNGNVVDIVMKILADMLNLNIFMLQNRNIGNEILIEVIKIVGQNATRGIFVQFQRDLAGGLSSHYNAIVKTDKWIFENDMSLFGIFQQNDFPSLVSSMTNKYSTQDRNISSEFDECNRNILPQPPAYKNIYNEGVLPKCILKESAKQNTANNTNLTKLDEPLQRIYAEGFTVSDTITSDESVYVEGFTVSNAITSDEWNHIANKTKKLQDKYNQQQVTNNAHARKQYHLQSTEVKSAKRHSSYNKQKCLNQNENNSVLQSKKLQRQLKYQEKKASMTTQQHEDKKAKQREAYKKRKECKNKCKGNDDIVKKTPSKCTPEYLKEYSRKRKQTFSEQKRLQKEQMKQSIVCRHLNFDSTNDVNDYLVRMKECHGTIFKHAIKDMPNFICTCDHRLLYKRSVSLFNKNKYNWNKEVVQTALSDNIRQISSDGNEYICQTCDRHLRRSDPHIPANAIANGLELPDIPVQLQNLNDLERRFISLRIPFMKLCALPKGGQYGINGACVNVPTKVDAACNLLPRMPADVKVVGFKLKRKLQYKGHHMSSKADPNKIMIALRWLKDNNFKYSDIVINNTWNTLCQNYDLWQYISGQKSQTMLIDGTKQDKSNCTGAIIKNKQNDKMQEQISSGSEFINSIMNKCRKNNKIISTQEKEVSAQFVNTNEDAEFAADQAVADENAHISLQPFSSCLQISDIEGATFCLAPGEGQTPKYIITDDDFETLSFPDLFPCGVGGYTTNEKRKTKLDLRTYYKQRILNCDGRFAGNIEYLLGAQYATELKQIKGNIGIALRLKKGQFFKGSKVTAGMLQSPNSLHEMMYAQQAYKMLQNVRGTPAYWKKMLDECLAMLRTFGSPTFFVTFSAADYHWPEIIQAVALQYGQHFSDDDVNKMDWQTKSLWLRRNPVTAVRAFEYRFNCMHKYIMSEAYPIGKVTNFIEKVEFQARGSPHIHAIYWIEGAPILDLNTDSEIIAFHDMYISATLPITDDELHNIVATRNMHTCSNYCKKRNGLCRFGFAKMPTFNTCVSRQDVDTSSADLICAKDVLSRIKEHLQKKNTIQCTLLELLHNLGITHDLYLTSLSVSSTSAKIIPKRDICDVYVNQYNSELISLWKANMDIQFVENAMSAVMYVCSYMMKAEKGMGDLLKRVCKEVQETSIKEQLKVVGNAFLGSREVSAQEAAMRLLSMPLMKKSRKVIFIHNGKKENRISMPRFDLKNLHADDEDVFSLSMHDRYAARPLDLAHLTLADFVTSYNTTGGDTFEHSDDVEYNDDTFQIKSKVNKIKLLNDLGYMHVRTVPAVMRTHKINKEKDPDDYYYGRLLLFYPWRNESEVCVDTEQLYNTKLATIEENARKYNQHLDEVDSATQLLYDNKHKLNMWDSIDVNGQQENAAADDEGKTVIRGMDQNEAIDDHLCETKTYFSGLGRMYTKESHKDLLTTKQYNKNFRELNCEQREAVLFNRNWCKKSIIALKCDQTIPAYQLFLSGPGGTGKSHVIQMIHRDIKYFFNLYNSPHTNIFSATSGDDPLVLLTAFTGTAAFNINGITLHSALSLPTTRVKHLSNEKRTTLETRLYQLKLLVIDEVSMISKEMLQLCHERLCSAKKMLLTVAPPFANTCILAVGDFYQLRPVCATSIFVNAEPHSVSQLAPSIWDTFTCIELTKIMRQRNDNTFAELLNNVRVKTPVENSNEDKLLSARAISSDTSKDKYPCNVIHTYAKNKFVAERNNIMLDELPGELYSCVAQDSVKDRNTQTFDIPMPDDPQKTGRLLKILKLKIGAAVMINNNIDTTDGLTNGAMGIVSHIICECNQIVKILVQFNNKNIGVEAKNNSTFKHIAPESVPIGRFQYTFDLLNYKSVSASRTQFPLTLSWAVTIHKLQGLTLDNIVVDMDIKKGPYGTGQAYVAFSRVKTYEGLYILNYTRSQIKVDSRVDEFMDEMKNKKVSYLSQPLLVMPSSGLKVIHQNVQGLYAHRYDVDTCRSMQDADVVCMSETHLNIGQQWPLKTFNDNSHYILRYERTIAKCGGVAICVKKCVSSCKLYTYEDSPEIVHIYLNTLDIDICCIYNSPTKSIGSFITILENILPRTLSKCIIVGDFNVNLFDNNSASDKLTTIMSKFGFKQYITNPTTDYGSLLDHLYIRNMFVMNTDVHDCYYSYHDEIYVELSTVLSKSDCSNIESVITSDLKCDKITNICDNKSEHKNSITEVFENKLLTCSIADSSNNLAQTNLSISQIDNTHFISHRTYIFVPMSIRKRAMLCTTHSLTIIAGHLNYGNVNAQCVGSPQFVQIIAGYGGDCLFRSLSYLITGSQVQHKVVRTIICNYIRNGMIDSYLTTSPIEYLISSQMELFEQNVWGSDVEIYAAAQLFETDIYVYSAWGNNGNKWLKFTSYTNGNACDESMYLTNASGNHFNAVLGI